MFPFFKKKEPVKAPEPDVIHEDGGICIANRWCFVLQDIVTHMLKIHEQFLRSFLHTRRSRLIMVFFR